jgi:exopolysaccharide biosynthesis polyprenyl glycosylphosphotransferase
MVYPLNSSARQVVRVLPLVLMDVCISIIAFMAAYILYIQPENLSLDYFRTDTFFQPHKSILLITPFVRVFTYSLFGSYDADVYSESLSTRLFKLCKAVTLGTVIIIVMRDMYRGVFEYSEFNYSRGVTLVDWFFNIVLISASYMTVVYFRTLMFKRGIGKRNIAIQGAVNQSFIFLREMNLLKSSPYEIKGIICDQAGWDEFSANAETTHLGTADNILEIINSHKLDEIIVTDTSSLGMELMDFVMEGHKRDVVVKLSLDLQGMLTHGRQLHQLAGQPVIQINEIAIEGFARVLKRTEDIVLCSIALAITFPLWVIIMLLIKRESPGPVIFNQVRVGKHGRTFQMYKFRSMHLDADEKLEEIMDQNEAEGHLFKMKDDPRCTRIGKFIRRTNLDELPQFLNVIKGEMSLVGPRPALPHEVSKYEEQHQRRLGTMPGITGLWQVNRGHNYNFDEVLNWDTYYIENWSLWLDIKIILKTIGVLVTGRYSY